MSASSMSQLAGCSAEHAHGEPGHPADEATTSVLIRAKPEEQAVQVVHIGLSIQPPVLISDELQVKLARERVAVYRIHQLW
jgi:hypothetical protein